ncbi:XAC2610-related protein [Chryseobacterium balustinum]|uniref:XAC2610-related protein n=1 Tax=Chryseobacterium balustinum TaxID=246 RepID=UPI003CE6ACDF
MKKVTYIYILSVLLTFSSCGKNTNKTLTDAEKNKVNSIERIKRTKGQNDIYINREFNEMTELVDVKTLKFKETAIDSIWYGLYNITNSENYIFAVHKFLQNPDVAKYRIMDTVNLKSKNIDVKIEEFSDHKILNLLLDKKLVKKWTFKLNSKNEQNSINGKEGQLRAITVDDKQLFKTTNFTYFIKTVSFTEEKKPRALQIKIIDKSAQNQLINFNPEYIYSAPEEAVSFFNDPGINQKINKQNLPEFIIVDINFDGLEDFVIANYVGGNAGTLYAYFIQDKDGKFKIDHYLTDQVSFFPRNIDFKNKTLTFLHLSGCCSQVNFKVKLQNSNKWKQTFYEEKPL